MSTVEKLHFKIGLSGTYWKKQPAYSILVDDTVITSDTITTPSEEVFYVEFDQTVEEGVQHSLKIRLENKDNSDTVENADKTGFLKDMLLNIKSVEIDDIDLGMIIFDKSTYVGDDPARPVMKKCINLGWNGTWSLEFDAPFYVWLLENI